MKLLRNKVYVEMRPITCGNGHPQRRPPGRHIVALFGKTVVRVEFSYNRRGVNYMCGACINGSF